MAVTTLGFKNQLMVEQHAREFLDGSRRKHREPDVEPELDEDGDDPQDYWYFEAVS